MISLSVSRVNTKRLERNDLDSFPNAMQKDGTFQRKMLGTRKEIDENINAYRV